MEQDMNNKLYAGHYVMLGFSIRGLEISMFPLSSMRFLQLSYLVRNT